MATSKTESPPVSSGSNQQNSDVSNPVYAAPQPPGSENTPTPPPGSENNQDRKLTEQLYPTISQPRRALPSLGIPVRGRGRHMFETPGPIPSGPLQGYRLPVNLTSPSDAKHESTEHTRKANDSQSKDIEETLVKKIEHSADRKSGNQQKQGVKQDTLDKSTSQARADLLEHGRENSKVHQKQEGTACRESHHESVQPNSQINSEQPPPYSLLPCQPGPFIPYPYSMIQPLSPGNLSAGIDFETQQPMYYTWLLPPGESQTVHALASTASVQEGLSFSGSGLQPGHHGPAATAVEGENSNIAKGMDDGQMETGGTFAKQEMSKETAPKDPEKELNNKSLNDSLEEDGGSSTEDTSSDKTLLVRGILGLSEEILQLFFESHKKSGGGRVQSVSIWEDDEALITFVDNRVADCVLKRGPTFKIGLNTLTVERPPKPDPRSVQVQGIPETVSKDLLELFFESKKRSSGGDIDHIEYEAGTGEAVITFQEAEVAQRVLSRNDLAINGSQLRVCPVKPKHMQAAGSDHAYDKSSTVSDPRVVYVHGVPTNIGSDTLELWLESKKYGGGEIEALELDSEKGAAIVTYVQEEDAARMLEKGTVNIGDAELTLSSKKVSDEKPPTHTSASANISCSTVQIQNVSKMSEHFLKLALEKQASGKIECISVYPERSMVIARFATPEGAVRILQRKSVTLEDKDYPVIPLYTEVHDKSPGCLAIMVTGINKDIDKERLEMYFSNRRKSGGFGKLSIFMKTDEGKAIITYESVDAVKSVIGKSKKGAHRLKTAKFDVVEMKPLPPPPLIAEPTEPNKLIMLEAPPVSKEQLEAFLGIKSKEAAEDYESGSDIVISILLYGWKNNRLLIEFSAKPDYKWMLAICTSRPLEDRMVSLQKVSLPTMIQVRAAQQLDEEDLELYFESKKSGGTDIKGAITMYKDERCAVIDYGDNNAVKSVLQKQHKVGDIPVAVDAYYPAFGVCPYGYDPTQPWNVLPEPFKYNIKSQFVWKFVFSNQSAWDLLSDVGKKFSFEISREKSANNALCVCYKNDSDGTVPEAKVWEQQCRDKLDQYFKSIRSENIPTLSKRYDDVFKSATEMTSAHDGILQVGDKQQSMIILTGWEPTVRSISEKIKGYIKEVEEKLLRQNKSTEEKLSLQPPFVTMIKAKQYNKELNKKFPKLAVCITSDGLSFRGLTDEVMSAKLQVYEEIVQKIVTTSYPCTAAKVKLLCKSQVRSFVISEFKKANITVVFEVKDSQLFLYAMMQEELQSGQEIIEKVIIEKGIPLQKESLLLLNGQAWTDLKAKFRQDFGEGFLLTEDLANNKIQLVVTSDKCDVLLEEIENFFVENTILQEQIEVEHPVIELIRRFYEDKLKVIERNFARYMVNIGITDMNFLVRGTKAGLQPSIKALQDLCNEVLIRDHVISHPGMEKYFHSEKGRRTIASIENTNKVICVEPKDIRDVSGNQQSYDREGSARVLYTGRLSGGPVVKVLVGDLTKHRVDAIVNAANGKLRHYGGLAGAILSAGGNIIQDECSKYMQNKLELLPGDVFTSSSGSLPCKFVIHAVGPVWKNGKQGEINELFEATARSLEEAEKHAAKSIAIPAISSGIFGFPLDESTRIICEAIVDYFKTNSSSSIAEVHLMDSREKGASLFQDSIRKHVTHVSNANYHASRSTTPPIGSSTVSDMTDNESSAQNLVSPGSTCDSIVTREGISITIKRGSLPDQQADALMNSTQQDLNLGAGGVSAVLLKAAGPVIQQECNNNRPSSFTVGDIVVTSGGNLPVKSIFHGYCNHWDGGPAAQGLKKVLANALKEAHSRQYQSMAVPAIGTGNLGYPHNVVIKSLVKEIVSFSAANENTTLKDIYVVLFPGDLTTMKAFEDYWKSPNLQQERQQRTRKLKSTQQERPTASKDKISGKTQPSPFADYSFTKETQIELVGRIGSVKIVVKKGDITKEDTDVIMNSTDQMFTKGAVFEALIKAGGKEIEMELQKSGHLQYCVMTGAGNLQCKQIVHINGSVMDLEECLLRAFQLVDSKGMRSLAMPALGTGNLRHDANEMSERILKVITNFFVKQKPQNLEEIRIVIFEKSVFKAFKHHISSTLKGEKQGFFTKILGFVSDLLWGNEAVANDTASVLTYRIYAMEMHMIRNVIKQLDDICKNESGRHVFDSEEDQEAIKNMNNEHRRNIMDLEPKYGVKINIQDGVRLKRIVVEGCSKDLVHCVAEISKILSKVEKEAETESMQDLLYKQVNWQFKDGSSFRSYPKEINYIIEKAYLNKKQKATWTEDEGSMELIIKDMIERCNGDPSTDVGVRRQAINVSGDATIQLPSTWSAMNPGEICRLVALNPTDQEYKKVANNFTPGNIKKIERVQNPGLYQIYEIRKQQIEKANPQMQNENTMYHGTASNSLDNINNSGFNRSYCGKNATVYGDGVYFALDPNYSARTTYSPPDANGNRYIYQSRVLVGNSITGGKGLKEPPYLNGSSGRRYDSVNDGSGAIVVIFHDAQAYPEYLITFQ